MPQRAREVRWFQTHADAQTVTSGGQANVEVLQALSVDQRKGATVTRIILELVLGVAQIDTKCNLKWGIVSLTEDANTAGAFPDADAALDLADWLVRGASIIKMSDVDDGSQFVRVSKDYRAQRILRGATDETHFIIDQNTSGATVNWDLWTRILVKLP